MENIKKDFKELQVKKATLAEKHGDTKVDEDDVIQINVGCKGITARRETLIYKKGTMIEALFSGRWDKEIQRDAFDQIFLDVNPECFQRIINYLSMLKSSLEEDLSQYLQVDKDLQLIFDHTMTYFGIEHPPSSTESSGTTRDPTTNSAFERKPTVKSTWETMTFDEFPIILKNNMHQEQKAMINAKEELERIKKNLEKEEDFVQQTSAQSLSDVVSFDVRGTLMTVKRSTLRIFKDSQLDR
eukprot:15362331-Ditylum_brightwellii.AAC.1